MRLHLLAGAAVLALSSPVAAQSCDYTFDDVAQNQIAAQGHPIMLVPDADLPAILAEVSRATGESYEGATRAFIANINGTVLLGVEMDGCLLPPIVIATPLEPASDTLSGRVGDKTFA